MVTYLPTVIWTEQQFQMTPKQNVSVIRLLSIFVQEFLQTFDIISQILNIKSLINLKNCVWDCVGLMIDRSNIFENVGFLRVCGVANKYDPKQNMCCNGTLYPFNVDISCCDSKWKTHLEILWEIKWVMNDGYVLIKQEILRWNVN